MTNRKNIRVEKFNKNLWEKISDRAILIKNNLTNKFTKLFK